MTIPPTLFRKNACEGLYIGQNTGPCARDHLHCPVFRDVSSGRNPEEVIYSASVGWECKQKTDHTEDSGEVDTGGGYSIH